MQLWHGAGQRRVLKMTPTLNNEQSVSPETSGAPPCLMRAWEAHARSLRLWLRHELRDDAQADDVLQDVFIKALRQEKRFCSLENARAWLFEVARNTAADHLRRHRPLREAVELPEDIAAEAPENAAVEGLSQCLPRVLAELSPEDREAIVLCDIEGITQADYAIRLGISLPGAKSRVQRARQRLKARLSEACRVRYDERGNVCCFTPRPPIAEIDD